MKTIIELNRYYISRTLTSTRLIMPLVVTIVFCGVFYNENGINPYSSFAATIVLSFAVMAWIVHTLQKQDTLEEQILILQSGGHERLYYGSRLLFFLLCDLLLSLIILIIPYLIFLYNGTRFTVYPMHMDMMAGFYLLHVCAGMCGGMMTALLHPRIVSNQKLALPFACLLLILTMTFPALLDDLQLPSILSWLFPPISNISIESARWTQMQMGQVLIYSLQMLVYAGLYAYVQIRMLVKRRFG